MRTQTGTAPKQAKALAAIRPLPSPRELKQALPLSDELHLQVDQQRQEIRQLLQGDDNRLLIITARARCTILRPH